MKTTWILTAWWLVLPLSLAAQEVSEGDAEVVHDQIRALRDQAIDALNRSDVDGLLDLVHDDVVFTAMNAEVCRGKDQIRAYFDRMMTGPDRIVETIQTDLKVDALTILHGEDTGVAYGSSQDQYALTNGMAFEVASRWSATLVQEGGRWLIASFHSSADVFDNPVLRQTRRLAYAAAALVALVGLATGWLVGRRRRKSA